MTVASDMTTHEGRANFRNAINIALVVRPFGERVMIPLNPQLVLALLDRVDELDPPPVVEGDVVKADRQFLNYVDVYAHRLRDDIAALGRALVEARRMGDSLEETAGVLSIAVEDRRSK